ncbi:hypothetical protein [Hydrogenobacter thermophilus]|uniref:hypothetical protein n=1 Tax=Hydrogenobacter thermophilus TaxID=940 RepID=UPI0002F242EB|nr:hypothetical protein [Hydrogenobacter thermophilus]
MPKYLEDLPHARWLVSSSKTLRALGIFRFFIIGWLARKEYQIRRNLRRLIVYKKEELHF